MKQFLLELLDVLWMFFLSAVLVYSPIIGFLCGMWWHCGFEAVMEIFK